MKFEFGVRNKFTDLELEMGRRASQLELARAVAMTTIVSPPPETEINPLETATNVLMEQVFGRRNIPHVPPHLQRIMLSRRIAQLPPPAGDRLQKAPAPSPSDRRQTKPHGRGHRVLAFRMA